MTTTIMVRVGGQFKRNSSEVCALEISATRAPNEISDFTHSHIGNTHRSEPKMKRGHVAKGVGLKE